MNDEAINENELVKETYAASLNPERLADFEEFWEAYIDNKIINSDGMPIESAFIQSHFSMALGIVERIRHENNEDNYFHKLVMSHPGMAIIITKGGAIIASNPDGDNLIGEAVTLKSIGIEKQDLSSLLTWAQQFSKRNETGKSPYLFKDIRFENAPSTTCFFLAPVMPSALEASFAGKDPYFLVTNVDLAVRSDTLPGIQEKYEMTKAEADVAMHIANGVSVTDIAEVRGVSLHTVRSQIKAILAKTDSRDMPDLVRLMLTLSSKSSAVISQSQRFELTQADDQLMRRFNVILPDGRYMEYIEQGHPFGKPVLQFHCITKSTRLTDQGAKLATLKGWRFITPYRAGFGNSDQNRQKSPYQTLSSAANDYKYLLDHLNIDRALLVGGWGGQFAQKFAAAYPERTSGLLLVSTVPVWHKSHLDFFKTRHRVIVKTAYYAPAAAPYMLRVAKAMIDSGRSKYFVTQVDEERSDDLESLRKDPSLVNVVAEAYENFFKQGVMPFLDDLKTIITDWTADSKKLTVPVTVLKGDKIINKPETAYDQFLKAVPQAAIKTVEGGGIYMRYTHFDRVLEELESLNDRFLTDENEYPTGKILSISER